MSRISYVGELGWEIYAPMEEGLRLWDTLWAAGQPLGVIAAGIGVYATTGRLEKGYRAHGNELELDFNLVEAGMARPTVKDADFVGKTAYLAQRASPPETILCTLTVDDPTSSSGVSRYMLGREPISHPGRHVPRRCPGASLVRHERWFGPVDRQARPDVVPAAGRVRVEGTKLAVEFFGERYPVTVAVVGSTPIFDPENARIRA